MVERKAGERAACKERRDVRRTREDVRGAHRIREDMRDARRARENVRGACRIREDMRDARRAREGKD
ncbi:MAG: hypothetical protein MSS48_09595 [Clostridiales bacterium]|nr:hypothetical protein [Clostridiales bacterium]MDY5462121.1 hypothetical protein [Hornefia butyriciproducens]